MRTFPRYQREKFIFISNLKNLNANEDYQLTLNRGGYLLSERYSDAREIALSQQIKKRRNLLISDNSNFSRIKSIANQFKNEARDLLNKALTEAEYHGEISEDTKSLRDSLIDKITKACEDSKSEITFEEITDKQIKIDPHYLIGLEVFTIPVLMICGLLHPVFKPQAVAVKDFQTKTYKLYQAQKNGKFGNKSALNKTANFLVLHAYDYDSAHQGTQQLEEQPEGLAISYGGAMLSQRGITKLYFGNTTEHFDEKLPEAYLISTAITLGAIRGLKENLPIHLLNVGSPILITLLGHLLTRAQCVSIDSTAPFKDASRGTIYGSKHAFLKMDMYKVAACSLINNQAYASRTPYFRQFENDFPSNWEALRAEFGITTSSSVNTTINTIKQNPLLVEKYIPFFSELRPSENPIINRLKMDRAGHNYWILRNICAAIRRKMDKPQSLEKWTRYQVERYKEIANRKWAKAVKHSFELGIKYKQRGQ